MKFRKLLYVATSIVAALFVADTVVSYSQIARFPDRERLIIENWVHAGDLPKCNPSSLATQFDQSSIEDTQSATEMCFSEAKVDEQIINASPDQPELDQAYYHLSCSTDTVSARFQIILGRTDYRIWCQYSLGNELDRIPEFNVEDAAIPPEPPWFVDRILSRIAD